MADAPSPSFAERRAAVLAEIAAASRGADRDPADTTLIAVSKGHGADAVAAALAVGQTVFGENRVQEAARKYPALRDAAPRLELHLIGPLQTNKAREAVALFDVIQTVDRPRLAAALADAMEREGRRPDCLIQVNTGREAQKAGIEPDAAEAFVERCIEEFTLPVRGLMCIPPVDEDPALHFALLREIGRRTGLPWLSMGMSADFPVAVRFGATHVRVGTALFGQRLNPA